MKLKVLIAGLVLSIVTLIVIISALFGGKGMAVGQEASLRALTDTAHITSMKFVNGRVLVIGTNAQSSAGRTYWVMSSTNRAPTAADWQPVATNTFAADGGFTNTLPVNGSRVRFLIHVP
jgi:hypothetical protein